MNPTFTRLLGFGSEDIVGQNIRSIIPPDLHKLHESWMSRNASSVAGGNENNKIFQRNMNTTVKIVWPAALSDVLKVCFDSLYCCLLIKVLDISGGRVHVSMTLSEGEVNGKLFFCVCMTDRTKEQAAEEQNMEQAEKVVCVTSRVFFSRPHVECILRWLPVLVDRNADEVRGLLDGSFRHEG